MNNELALRTIGYLIGHYKTHNETIINSQEIEAINFILEENQKYKEVIDKIKDIFNNGHFEDGCDCLEIEELLDNLKEVK